MNITPYTYEDYVAHLKEGVGDTCLVCGNDLHGYWTDYNGQIKCGICGCTYQILGCHVNKRFLEEYGIEESDVAERYCDTYTRVPLYKEYWKQVGIRLPIGMFISDRNAPTESEGKSWLFWLLNNMDEIESIYPDVYNWDVIKKAVNS